MARQESTRTRAADVTRLRAQALPARPESGHKGTFGTVLVVGGCCRGSTRMIGAPSLAALGALRAGCGLCRIAAPAPIIGHVLRIAPSATGIALACGRDGQVKATVAGPVLRRAVADTGVVVLGPGLGQGCGAMAVVRTTLRAALRNDKPVVVDADALNALATAGWLRLTGHGARRGRDRAQAARLVLTPHPGEWKRLAASVGVKGDPVRQASRGAAATTLAARLGAVVLLKGAQTVVSDGTRLWRNRTGNVALATGGTGDVLAGVIGGLLAQLTDADDSTMLAACAGASAHGRAADLWATNRRASGGLLAADLLEWLPRAVEELRPP